MGMKFRKSFKVAPGIKINITNRSIGVSAGRKGARVSVNSRGTTRTTVGIPGTGLSYTHTSRAKKGRKKKTSNQSTPPIYSTRRMSDREISHTLKSFLSLGLILVGIVFLFISLWKGIAFIAVGILIFFMDDIKDSTRPPIQRQEGLEQEIRNTLFSNNNHVNEEENTISLNENSNNEN